MAATLTPTMAPASKKQWRLLERLMDERGVTRDLSGVVTEIDASAIITELIGLPRIPAAGPGFYLLDGDLFRVRQSRLDRIYAEYLYRSDETGTVLSWKFAPGVTSRLRGVEPISEKKARKWAKTNRAQLDGFTPSP